MDRLDRARLVDATNNLVETFTSEAFIERMHTLRDRAERGEVDFDEVGKLLSIDGLRDAGAKLPDDFRLTSRTFEDAVKGFSIDFNPDVLPRGGGDVAWGACAGGGAVGTCGCAGGST